MRREAVIPSPRQTACRCGSMVNLVPFTDDVSVMIPVDVDRDPSGGLVIVGSRAGFTIRPVRDGEAPEERFRRRAHWDTCPHLGHWRETMRAVGIGVSVLDPMRAGPCVGCWQRHPWHYGGPIASPLCDRCRVARGMEPMGEYD